MNFEKRLDSYAGVERTFVRATTATAVVKEITSGVNSKTGKSWQLVTATVTTKNGNREVAVISSFAPKVGQLIFIEGTPDKNGVLQWRQYLRIEEVTMADFDL